MKKTYFISIIALSLGFGACSSSDDPIKYQEQSHGLPEVINISDAKYLFVTNEGMDKQEAQKNTDNKSPNIYKFTDIGKLHPVMGNYKDKTRALFTIEKIIGASDKYYLATIGMSRNYLALINKTTGEALLQNINTPGYDFELAKTSKITQAYRDKNTTPYILISGVIYQVQEDLQKVFRIGDLALDNLNNNSMIVPLQDKMSIYVYNPDREFVKDEDRLNMDDVLLLTNAPIYRLNDGIKNAIKGALDKGEDYKTFSATFFNDANGIPYLVATYKTSRDKSKIAIFEAAYNEKKGDLDYTLLDNIIYMDGKDGIKYAPSVVEYNKFTNSVILFSSDYELTAEGRTVFEFDLTTNKLAKRNIGQYIHPKAFESTSLIELCTDDYIICFSNPQNYIIIDKKDYSVKEINKPYSENLWSNDISSDRSALLHLVYDKKDSENQDLNKIIEFSLKREDIGQSATQVIGDEIKRKIGNYPISKTFNLQ